MFVVKWVTSTGEPGWFEVDDVQAAVGHVEHLRNRDGVDDAKIFRLEHVAFEFRPYYRVELADSAPSAAAAPPVSFAASIAPDPAPAAPIAASAEVSTLADVAPEPVAAGIWADSGSSIDTDANGNHRRGLFGR